jgi:hypothetical protein
MHAVVGISQTIEDARRGEREVFRVVARANIRLVSAPATGAEIDTLPTDDAEQPGMGLALGRAVGDAAGAAPASLLVLTAAGAQSVVTAREDWAVGLQEADGE